MSIAKNMSIKDESIVDPDRPPTPESIWLFWRVKDRKWKSGTYATSQDQADYFVDLLQDGDPERGTEYRSVKLRTDPCSR